MPKYRKGLSDATNHERLWLLAMERRAINYASQECWEQIVADPRNEPDRLPRIFVRAANIRWFRSQGRLFVNLGVHLGPGRLFRSFRWRSPVLKLAGDPSRAGVNGSPLTMGRRAGTLSGWRSGTGGTHRPSALPDVAGGDLSVAGPWPGQLSLFPDIYPHVSLPSNGDRGSAAG